MIVFRYILNLKTLLLLVAFICITSCQTCRQGSDVIILLHSSPTISAKDFGRHIDFIAELIFRLNINNGDTRVGFLYYTNRNTKTSYPLNTFTTGATAVSAIRRVQHVNGAVSLGEAVTEIQTQMFAGSAGDRQSRPNVVLLISDGEYKKDTTVLSRVLSLKQSGVTLITLGLGKWVAKKGLELLASVPQNENFYHAETYAQFISDTLSDVKMAICNDVDDCRGVSCGTGDCVDQINSYQCVCEEGSTGPQCNFFCRSSMDLVVAVDTSGSIGYSNFQMVQQFVRNVIQGVDIVGGSRVGVAAFSDQAQVIYNLNRYPTSSRAAEGVTISYDGGTTNTAGVLRLVRQEMFTPSRGDRRGIPNVLILITDGKSNNRIDTLREAALVMDSDIHVVVVGIGDSLNMRELRAIASYPDSNNVFIVSQFGGLLTSTILSEVLTTVCNNENECRTDSCLNGGVCIDRINDFTCNCPTGYSGKDCKRRCSNLADVVLLVDSSSCIPPNDYLNMTDTLRKVISHWDVSPERIRVAVVYFSSRAQVLFHFNDYSTKNQILNAMLYLPYVGVEANITDAIRVMREEVLRENRGDRPFIPNFAIVVTSQPASINKELVVDEAIKARIEGTLIYVITILDRTLQPIDHLRLNGVASQPQRNYRINMRSVEQFNRDMDQVVATICNDENDCQSSPCRNFGRCFDSLHSYTCDCDERFTGLNCEIECTRQMDLVFLVDLSGSLYDMVSIMQSLIQAVTRGINFALRRTRVALVTFNGETTIEFNLNSLGAKEEVLQALRLERIGVGSRLASGLQTVNFNVFTPDAGDRDGIDDHLIVLTDGQITTENSRVAREADSLRRRGVSIYTVGVGSRTNREVLQAVSGDSGSALETRIYSLVAEDQVDSVAGAIVEQLCF